METAENSVRRSGVTVFVARLVSVVTGLMFILLLTRNTTAEQYGIWSNVFAFVYYFTILSTVYPFWTGRFVARGMKGAAKTGIVITIILAVAATFFYLVTAPYFTTALGVFNYVFLYFIASVHVVEIYLLVMFESLLQVKKPQAVGYGLILCEICKVVIAYTVVTFFGLALLGCMMGLLVAIGVQLGYYLRLLRGVMNTPFQMDYAREWTKASTLNFYTLAGAQLMGFMALLLFIFGGEVATGNYAAAITFANIIGYAIFVSFALYPKLLANEGLHEAAPTFRLVLLFAVPMTVGAIVLADSYLAILNEAYVRAFPVLWVLAIDVLAITMYRFDSYLLLGTEKIDECRNLPLRQLVRSNIFKVFSLPYLYAAVALPLALLSFYFAPTTDPVQAALYVATADLIGNVLTLMILRWITRNATGVCFPFRATLKFLVASTIMAAVLFSLPHTSRIYITLVETGIGGLVYLSTLGLIDCETRRNIKRELTKVKTFFFKNLVRS